jgi:hypothetical protein
MDGVILFVDDNLDEYQAEDNEIKRTLENQLFEELRKQYPVLGVRSLDLAEEAIKSIGAFSAVILDWVFDNKKSLLQPGEDENLLNGVRSSREGLDTLDFLKNNEFYSLIYIFSNEDVQSLHGAELRKKYRKRVKFRKKVNAKDQAKKIAKEVIEWRKQNQNLLIPSIWTKTINQSVQQILLELATADHNWIRELAMTAKDDGVNGETFIVQVLQYLLSESLIQDPLLIASIREHVALDISADEEASSPNDKSVAKLFRRIFYSKLEINAPVMTGDICKINRNKYGLIVTPECDIKEVVNDPAKTFELLTFSKNSFESFLSLQINYSYARNQFAEWSNTNRGKEKLDTLRGRFNNGDSKYHILPSFPFSETMLGSPVAIDLSAGCERLSYAAVKEKRPYKLNAPFIQQLRQRYISYLGRVGTPSLPLSLRNLNLK